MSKTSTTKQSEMAIIYVVMSRLMLPAKDHDAFKMGLINEKYKVLRDPETEDEIDALSPLNIFIFKLKRALGTRVISIFRHIYLNNFDENAVIDKLAIKGNIEARGEIQRLQKQMTSKSNIDKLKR